MYNKVYIADNVITLYWYTIVRQTAPWRNGTVTMATDAFEYGCLIQYKNI